VANAPTLKKILCLLAFSIVFIPLKANYKITPIPSTAPIKVAETSNIWDGYSKLRRICSCESWGSPDKEPREFKDGKILRGFPNPEDIGACQINTKIWEKTAQKLGDDLFSYHGNIQFAKWLYDQEGDKPWLWSKSCWNG
jgi:hypothetical protein